MVRHPSLCKTCNNSCGPSPGVFATDHAGHCSLAFPVPGKTQVKLQMVSRTVILACICVCGGLQGIRRSFGYALTSAGP